MDKLDVFIYVVIIGILSVGIYIYLVNRDTFDLKCVISTVDGNKYCVRDRREVNAAADILARITEKCKKLAPHRVDVACVICLRRRSED
jgi:hypothetical protein